MTLAHSRAASTAAEVNVMRRTTHTVWPAAFAALSAALPSQSPVPRHELFDRVHHVVVPSYRSFAPAPRQPIEIERVQARVEILEQTARTTLQVELRNPSSMQEEAVLLLPVPSEAAVSQFAFDGPAKEPTARLLPADEARRTYDEIVRKVRDPGLLEFAGARLIRTSVFPIAPRATSKVQLTYEHVLEADGDRVDYELLRSEAVGQTVPWEIVVDVRTKAPISMLYSPSHAVNTDKISARHHRLRVDRAAAAAPGAFRLAYLVERGATPAASLFAYPDPKVGGGYFLMLLGAPHRTATVTPRREVTLVFDRSGSMAGEKMDQARAALQQVVEALDDGEAFNIIDYSTTVERFAERPVVKTPETLAQARRYIAALRPIGGTNIHDALLEALRQEVTPGTLPLVLFLTDGLPTVGCTAEQTIRDMVAAGNPAQRRIFAFGVGQDVNVPLLDRIAETTRGTSAYVLPGEDVEVKVGRVFRKLCGPVLANPELTTVDAQGAVTTRRVRERYPQLMPDVFDGDSAVLLGQYREDEPLRFVLVGDEGESRRRFSFEFDLAKASTKNSFVPRLWATRRVADLIDQVRQAGADTGRPRVAGADPFADPKLKELRDEILRLSAEFGILTEYTSFLATEGTQLDDWAGLLIGCQTELHNRAWSTRTGLPALNQGLNLKVFGKEQTVLNPSNCYFDGNLARVETTAVQQICDRAFFRRGNQWIDGRLLSAGNLQPVRTIQFGSPEHLQLVHKLASENRAGTLSLTGEIVLRIDGEVLAINNQK
ncbi:MAG: VIT domain-containing protein [Planctomycetota bacterium]